MDYYIEYYHKNTHSPERFGPVKSLKQARLDALAILKEYSLKTNKRDYQDGAYIYASNGTHPICSVYTGLKMRGYTPYNEKTGKGNYSWDVNIHALNPYVWVNATQSNYVLNKDGTLGPRFKWNLDKPGVNSAVKVKSKPKQKSAWESPYY